MEKISVIIERAEDGTYNVYCTDYPVFFGLGKSIDEAREDMLETIRLTKEVGKEKAAFWPEWLDGEYSFDYTAISL